MANYADCPNYLSEFLFYMLTIKGRSQRTVDAYYIRSAHLSALHQVRQARERQSRRPGVLRPTLDQDIPLETVASITLSDVYQFLNYAASDRTTMPRPAHARYRPSGPSLTT